MADHTLRIACTTIANQLFSITAQGESSVSTSNAAAAQRRLHAIASRVSDAALSLYRLCSSPAQGGPVAITTKGAQPMEEAALCVCAVVRAAQPWLWLSLTRRAVVLRPRNPVLRLGVPTPLPISLKEIERFGGRSQRLVERLLRPPASTPAGSPSATASASPRPSSSSPPPPSSSPAGAVLSPLQAEQLAVCYFWAITSPAERRKHSKHGDLYEASVLTPPSHTGVGPSRRAGGGEKDDNNSGDDEDAQGATAGVYRRDRFWQAAPQPPQSSHQGPPSETTTAADEVSADHTGPSLNTRPRGHTAAGDAHQTLRGTWKRLRELAPQDTTSASSCPHQEETALASRRFAVPAHVSKTLAAQARLYDDDLVPLPTDSAGPRNGDGVDYDDDDEDDDDPRATRRARLHDRPDGDAGDVHSGQGRRHNNSNNNNNNALIGNDDTQAGQLWQRLADVLGASDDADAPPDTAAAAAAAAVTTTTPHVEASGDVAVGEETQQKTSATTTTMTTATRLAPRAARLLGDLLVPSQSTAAAGAVMGHTGVEELCAKVELVKAHLYWQRLESCVTSPLWLSQRTYVCDAPVVSSSSSSPTLASDGANPLPSPIASLFTHLGSSYHHHTPLLTAPFAQDSALSGVQTTGRHQAHFLAPGRGRFGVGLDVSGPRLSSRAVSLTTAPLLWTRLILCAAWLRSYATVYLPTMLGERMAQQLQSQRSVQDEDEEDEGARTSAHALAALCPESGRARDKALLWFDPSPGAVSTQQALASFCLDVVKDAYARFNGGPAPPPSAVLSSSSSSSSPLCSPSSSSRAAAAAGRTSASPSSQRRDHGERAGTTRPQPPSRRAATPASSRSAVCPVCDGLTRQAPPILCGALLDDRAVLQQHIRAQHLPSRSADPHCLTPLLTTGRNLPEGVRAAWRAWWEEEAVTAHTATASATRGASVPVEAHDLFVRGLARRLHAIVEALVGLQRAGKLCIRAGGGQTSSDGHEKAAMAETAPSQTCCPDLLPLSALDATLRTAVRRPHPHARGTAAPDKSTTPSSEIVSALNDAYGWAAGALFTPLLSSHTAAPHQRRPARDMPNESSDSTASAATPSLASLTEMVAAVVPPTVNAQDVDGLSHWQRCAVVWHDGSVVRPASAPLPTASQEESEDVATALSALSATQEQILAWLGFVPSIPLIREEDGVVECGKCFNLFHQSCVCPSQRDMLDSAFLCHACRIREATY